MKLHIQRLPVQVHLGVYAWEKQAARPVLIDLRVRFDGAKPAQSDALADALDYVAVEQCALRTAQARHYELLESLVAAVGTAVLALPGALEVEVEIHKPGALEHAESVSISEVYRT